MIGALERYWLAPIPAARPWFFLKSALLLFAVDVFAEHLRPAWRYGTAEFNVAHFAVLEVLPAPTTALYVGVLVIVGLLAFVGALAPRPPRAVLVAIAVLYLWSWSSSMHDSYQHHYLLSLFLLAFALFPRLSSRDLFGVPSALRSKAPRPSEPAHKASSKKKKQQKAKTSAPASAAASAPETMLDDALPHGVVPRASSWAMVLVWTTAAAVYAYTAISKTEPDWRSGEALRNITNDGATIPGAVELFGAFGIAGDALWPFLGTSVIALQIACALGYATAPLRDRTTGVARHVLEGVAIVALLLALSFHLGAEYMGLQIGWFSWYMILLALATFLPARLLSGLVLFATWPAREIAEGLSTDPSPIVAAILALLAGALLVAVGMDLDLPGALAASVIAAVATMGGALYALVRRQLVAEVRAIAIALAIGAAVIPVSIRGLGGESAVGRDGQPAPHHDARYDYWRFAGGDFRRRGEWALARNAYLHADRYAPEGQSRRAQAEEMRERIESEGPRRAEQ
ncbi:MAG: hypothetical protein M3Y87_31150 [Myxococcota bacterium]|nr:hypothetical protein [Myxococcota bacterium]